MFRGRTSTSHHHQTRRSPFRMSSARSKEPCSLGDAQSVLFAVGITIHFEVVVSEDLLAVLRLRQHTTSRNTAGYICHYLTREAIGMELLLQLRL